MSTAVIFGATGAVGSQILATLLAAPSGPSITTISRRAPSAPASARLHPIVSPDPDTWSAALGALTPPPSIVFNAVGTTIGTAGSVAAQWAIDHDLCVATAEAAKAAGVPTFVYCSSAGTTGRLSPFALTPYAKMKRGVEARIRALQFDHAIILRPGMILGRPAPKNPWLEAAFRGLRVFGQGVQDGWAQDQTVIGRAAVAAVRMVEEGRAPAPVWVLEQADIVRLGRDEWKD